MQIGESLISWGNLCTYGHTFVGIMIWNIRKVDWGQIKMGLGLAYWETGLWRSDGGEQYKGLKLESDMIRFLSKRAHCGSNVENKLEVAKTIGWGD